MIRKSLDLKPGQKVALRVVGDHAEIKPLPPDPIEYLCGIFKDYPTSLAEELLTERQKDQAHEEAAKIKGRYPLSYADTFAVATALRKDAAIITGDPEFKQVESLVSIEWL